MAGSEKQITRLKDISKKLAKEKTKSKEQVAAEKVLNAALAKAEAVIGAAGKIEDSRKKIEDSQKKLEAAIAKHNAGIAKVASEVRAAMAQAGKQAKVDGPLRGFFLEANGHLQNLANNLPKIE